AAVSLDDATHIGKSYPGALEIIAAVQPLKHAEQLVRIGHVEPDAVVADVEDTLSIDGSGAANLDFRARPGAGVLERVRYEIQHGYPQHRAIALNARQCVDRPPHVALSAFALHLAHDVADQFVQIDFAIQHLRAAHARK